MPPFFDAFILCDKRRTRAYKAVLLLNCVRDCAVAHCGVPTRRSRQDANAEIRMQICSLRFAKTLRQQR
jgi:hypothetical protein